MRSSLVKAAISGALALFVVVGIGGGATAKHRSRHGHAAHGDASHTRPMARRVRPAGDLDRSYGTPRPYDPTPTCYDSNGTPYDPDIIGGPNHVGDGGPAANLGGYDPCGF